MPSAGGCHCIETVIVAAPGQDPEISLYDSTSHGLIEIDGTGRLSSVRNEVSQVVSPGEGTITLFAADQEKIGSLYENGESLLWRDAGVLIGGLSIVAEALKINSCALGFTGQSLIASILNDERFVGVGGMIFGSKQ